MIKNSVTEMRLGEYLPDMILEIHSNKTRNKYGRKKPFLSLRERGTDKHCVIATFKDDDSVMMFKKFLEQIHINVNE